MGFTIPAQNPGGAQAAAPPNVIRASTVNQLIQADRFTLSSGTRLVASCPAVIKTTATSTVFVGQFTTSQYFTRVFICLSGSNSLVDVTVNSLTQSFVLAAPFTAASAVGAFGMVPNTQYTFSVDLGPNPAGTQTLNGVYLVEERMTTLP